VFPHYLAIFRGSNFGKSDTVGLLKISIPPDVWPQNSPDLNIINKAYKFLGIVQQQAYQSRVRNIDTLKQRSLHIWHGIDQTIIYIQCN